MAATTSLLLVHQNRILRECLVKVLSQADGLEAADLDHADPLLFDRIVQAQPHIALVGASLPNSKTIEILRLIRLSAEGTKVLVLVSDSRDEPLLECVSSGADGYVAEDSTLDELRMAITEVVSGERFCSPRIAFSMMDQIASSASGNGSSKPRHISALSYRETEILRLVADGRTNKQIAKQLSLSLFTVKNHLHRIFEKLDVGNRFDAVQQARRRQWMDRSPSSL